MENPLYYGRIVNNWWNIPRGWTSQIKGAMSNMHNGAYPESFNIIAANPGPRTTLISIIRLKFRLYLI